MSWNETLAPPASRGTGRPVRITHRWKPRLLAAVLAAACAGCGGGGGGDAPTVAPVTGKVTRKGTPLPGAKVTFSPIGLPAEATASPSFAITNAAGEYELSFNRELNGAMVARHRVKIVKDPAFDDNDRPLQTGVVVPAKYNASTTLEVTVPAEGLAGGPADFDLDF